MKLNRRGVVFALLVFSIAVLGAQGGRGADETADLGTRVAALEKTVADLKARVAVLEKSSSGSKAEASPKSQEPWREKSNWRALLKGMTKEEVKKVLGDPGKISNLSSEVWYYPSGLGGSVAFDSSGKLTGWSEP